MAWFRNRCSTFALTAVLWTAIPAGSCTLIRIQETHAAARRHVDQGSLAQEIIRSLEEDQSWISELQKAEEDPDFNQSLQKYKAILIATGNPNFYTPMLYDLWAPSPQSPDIVRRYVAFHEGVNERVKTIVAQSGWPQRAAVGDEAAADFFFLFGHADDDNPWRMTQLKTIGRVFREDHVNPRMYAHLCDRLANVAKVAQRYGSVMGPGSRPGSAKLYWPLIDSVSAADARRAVIGLPSIEADFQKFRDGAQIGPYMTPMAKGANWAVADVYIKPVGR